MGVVILPCSIVKKNGSGRNSIENTIENKNNPGSNFSKDLQGYVHKSPDYHVSIHPKTQWKWDPDIKNRFIKYKIKIK